MNMNDKNISLALSVISSPGSNKIWQSISTCTPSYIYNSVLDESEIKTVEHIAVGYHGTPLEVAHQIRERADALSVNIIDYWDEQYPPVLREIYRPPIVLYSSGKLPAGEALAIVGTRKSDRTSSGVARRLSAELTMAGFVIVSGMAVGIDREAHLGALHNDRETIGVLANGIDIVYPVANRDLYTAVKSSKKSCLLSEYPPGIVAGKWTFVRRNRIISGLSRGTVVVKAPERSGALLTAKYALEQNREVFACPGNSFDDSYKGCHKLIQSGATLVSGTTDVLKEFSLRGIKKNPVSEDTGNENIFDTTIENPELPFFKSAENPEFVYTPLEKKILEIVPPKGENIDRIMRSLEYPASEVNEAITMMELSGTVVRNGNVIERS